DLDPFMSVQPADDLRIDPRDRLELARPVGSLVRPGNPRGGVRLPFRGPAAARVDQSRYLFRIGTYASIRRSLRNGQFRRVSSMLAGSNSTTRISGSCPASAMTRPNGSATKEWPKKSIPSVPGSGS